MTKYYLGCDPDMHRTAFAVVDDKGQCCGVWVVKVKEHTERDAVVHMIHAICVFFTLGQLPEECVKCVVESQEMVYTAKSGRNPRSLLFLANISGAVVSLFRMVYPNAELHLTAPQKWKGNVPKLTHQGRIMLAQGWEFSKRTSKGEKGADRDGYCVPTKIEPPILQSAFEDGDQAQEIGTADWKHINDAIGIARWLRDEDVKLQRFAAAQSRAAQEPQTAEFAALPVPKPKKQRRGKKS